MISVGLLNTTEIWYTVDSWNNKSGALKKVEDVDKDLGIITTHMWHLISQTLLKLYGKNIYKGKKR